jgi:hypothetical protein
MTIEEIVNTLQEQQRELEYHRNSHSGFSNIPSTPLNGPSPFGSFPSTPTIPTMPTPTPTPTMKEEKEEEFPTSCYPFIPPIPKKENPSSSFPPPSPNSGMNEFKIMVNRPGEAPQEASPQEIISIIQEQQTHINTMTQHHETEIVEYKKKINELETLLFESNIKLANVGKTNTS